MKRALPEGTVVLQKVADTVVVEIYMAGDVEDAWRVCQAYCDEVGLCVTVEPLSYVYTGGSEDGFRVGLRHYPRFPSGYPLLDMQVHSTRLGERLMLELDQQSFMVVGPKYTRWFSRRPEDLA